MSQVGPTVSPDGTMLLALFGSRIRLSGTATYPSPSRATPAWCLSPDFCRCCSRATRPGNRQGQFDDLGRYAGESRTAVVDWSIHSGDAATAIAGSGQSGDLNRATTEAALTSGASPPARRRPRTPRPWPGSFLPPSGGQRSPCADTGRLKPAATIGPRSAWTSRHLLHRYDGSTCPVEETAGPVRHGCYRRSRSPWSSPSQRPWRYGTEAPPGQSRRVRLSQPTTCHLSSG